MVLAVLVLVVAFLFFFFVWDVLPIWFHAKISGAREVNLINMVILRIQQISLEEIQQTVQASIMASKSGVGLDAGKLESIRQANINVARVIKAMIIADKAGIALTLEQAKVIESSGRNVLEAVQMTARPFVEDTSEVTAKAKDGIELKIHCRVTMKANLEKYIGGAEKGTVLARVGEGIVSAVGSAATHHEIIANPKIISDYILSVDRDDDDVPDVYQNTAFKVLTIDVADINLGENVDARLESDRAIASAKEAQAEAESRRADAVRHEEEVKIKVNTYKAKLISAEADIHRAIAKYFNEKES